MVDGRQRRLGLKLSLKGMDATTELQVVEVEMYVTAADSPGITQMLVQ